MVPGVSLVAGHRRAALLCLAVVALLPASAAQAQRLLTLVSGVGEAASVGDSGPSIGPAPTAVQVDLELLRRAPARLEVPTPEGGFLSAEQSVFEDRGGGDLMWSGGQRDAEYDTVVLTVEGGRLVGRFGAAGGGVYQIHAERDGRGGMAPIVGPSLEAWCGVEAGVEDFLGGAARVAAGALAADLPERVSNPQSHDRLDILVAYTATAAENWAARGGVVAAIRHAGDYMKMVFRNNRIEVEPHIVHIAKASAALDRAGRDVGGQVFAGTTGTGNPPFLAYEERLDADLLHLRHAHRADLVHLFTGEPASLLGACGRHSLLGKDGTAESQSARAGGWTTNNPNLCPDYALTFVHETGHGLGADHDPPNGYSPDILFRPYAYGHANFGVMPSVGTAMSYRGQVEPFFSTPRLRPYGSVVGVAGKQDNERLLQETVHIAVRYSDYLRSLKGAPAAPTDLRISYEDSAVRLSWRDNAPDADGYELVYCFGESRTGEIRTLEGRTEATLTLESLGNPSRCDFMVRATKGGMRSLRSNIVYFVVPDEPIAAPSDVFVTADSALGSPEVRWTDNSNNEAVFDVQLLLDGEPIQRHGVAADSERSSFGALWAKVAGRDIYGARVFACSGDSCSESSNVATFRWAHPRGPRLVADLSASAIGPTTVRVAWTPEPDAFHYSVHANLPGWEFRRRWYGSSARRGRAHLDFKNLARGGRYRFVIIPSGQGGQGVSSVAYLTLGARGEGPTAPSELVYVLKGNRARLRWKDNSSDERGFEVQYAPRIGTRAEEAWQRLLTVPANTESVAHDEVPAYAEGNDFRVFAYNERGYSASTGLGVAVPHLPPEASFQLDIPCDEQLCRTLPGTLVSFMDTSSGNVTQRRWRFGDGATSILHSPTHAWSSPGIYTVILMVSNGSGQDSTSREVLVGPAPSSGPCRASEETLCLQGSRFEVRANWWSADGQSGDGQIVEAGTNDSGLFRFFNPLNWEILIKVLDGCGINGRMWVLGAATTDLGYRIVVTDTVTGESRS